MRLRPGLPGSGSGESQPISSLTGPNSELLWKLETAGSLQSCCVSSTSEVGRQIPKLGSQVNGDLKDLGQAGIGTPASVPWC